MPVEKWEESSGQKGELELARAGKRRKRWYHQSRQAI